MPIFLGIVGDTKDGEHYVWTHKKLEIGYNGQQIVDVNLTSDDRVHLVKDAQISFSYEVSTFLLS